VLGKVTDPPTGKGFGDQNHVRREVGGRRGKLPRPHNIWGRLLSLRIIKFARMCHFKEEKFKKCFPGPQCGSRRVWSEPLHCVSKNIPDIFDCNLKTNYQILIIFGVNIPDTTCHLSTCQCSCNFYCKLLPNRYVISIDSG